MKNIQIGGCAVALLVASSLLAACGGSEKPAARVAAATPASATTKTSAEPAAPPKIALLEGPRGPNDAMPSFVKDGGVTLDRRASRLLRTDPTGQIGLWLAPANVPTDDGNAGTDNTSSDVPMVCLRVVPLTGPARGGGPVSCLLASEFVRAQRLLAFQPAPKGAHAAAGHGVGAPADATVSGVVPKGVRTIRIETTDGHAITQRVVRQAFSVSTPRTPTRLDYRTATGPVGVRFNGP